MRFSRLICRFFHACWLTMVLLAACHAGEARLLIQQTVLAGSQYYDLLPMLKEIQVGDRLTLIREPDNRHDRRAVRVEWHGHKLGYLPRAENQVVSAALDEGEALIARVARLVPAENPWERMQIEIWAKLN